MRLSRHPKTYCYGTRTIHKPILWQKKLKSSIINLARTWEKVFVIIKIVVVFTDGEKKNPL